MAPVRKPLLGLPGAEGDAPIPHMGGMPMPPSGGLPPMPGATGAPSNTGGNGSPADGANGMPAPPAPPPIQPNAGGPTAPGNIQSTGMATPAETLPPPGGAPPSPMRVPLPAWGSSQGTDAPDYHTAGGDTSGYDAPSTAAGMGGLPPAQPSVPAGPAGMTGPNGNASPPPAGGPAQVMLRLLKSLGHV